VGGIEGKARDRQPAAALLRLKKLGDLFAPVLTLKQKLPKAFRLSAAAPTPALKAYEAARQKLLELAAQKMNVPVTELSMANGKIGQEKSNRTLTIGEVLDGRQLTDEVRLPVALKAKDKYRLVGKAVPREDIRLMVSGQPVYVQDLRFPGMVHARVVRPPATTRIRIPELTSRALLWHLGQARGDRLHTTRAHSSRVSKP